MIGRVFNRLTVVGQGEPYINPNTGYTKKRLLCFCLCGNSKSVPADNLVKGATQSCGCLHKERTRKANRKHGEAKTRFYTIWVGINKRCKNPKASTYANYGGRGIKVCDRWDSKNSDSFENFKADMWGTYDDKLTIDRIDNEGNYEPTNCRWATYSEQSRNKRDTIRGKSNILGVTEQPNRYIATYYTSESRKQKTKSFSRLILGDELALFAATEFRNLAELKFSGGILESYNNQF